MDDSELIFYDALTNLIQQWQNLIKMRGEIPPEAINVLYTPIAAEVTEADKEHRDAARKRVCQFWLEWGRHKGLLDFVTKDDEDSMIKFLNYIVGSYIGQIADVFKQYRPPLMPTDKPVLPYWFDWYYHPLIFFVVRDLKQLARIAVKSHTYVRRKHGEYEKQYPEMIELAQALKIILG